MTSGWKERASGILDSCITRAVRRNTFTLQDFVTAIFYAQAHTKVGG